MDTKLTKILLNAGITGIAIGLIALIWFLVQSNNAIVGNHIDHSTQAINKNTEVLTKLGASVETFNDNQQAQTEVLRELKDVIRYGQ